MRRAINRGLIPKAYVSNGNHRVAAAILRGKAKIDAYMPIKDWKLFMGVL